MVAPRRSHATYDDLLALPDNVVGELIAGELYASPRPAVRHAIATGAIFGGLDGPFQRGHGGPGGWLILFEPELHLGGDALVPDIAGWRRERVPVAPDLPYLALPPDWVAEVASPSTAALDRGPKLAAYAREQVRHVWIVDPTAQLLEVLELDGKTYRIIQVASGAQKVRAVPFDAIELDLAVLWKF